MTQLIKWIYLHSNPLFFICGNRKSIPQRSSFWGGRDLVLRWSSAQLRVALRKYCLLCF